MPSSAGRGIVPDVELAGASIQRVLERIKDAGVPAILNDDISR